MKKKVNRGDLAEKYFLEGYSCSQAVVLAYLDKMKLDKKSALKISSPFGGGMARLREVCGAFSGALIVLGYLKGNESVDVNKKLKLYQDVQRMANEFIVANGFLRCGDLLKVHKENPNPSKRTAKFYHARPCLKIVNNAARILEKYVR